MAPAQAVFMAVISVAMVLNYMLSTTTSGNRSSTSAAGTSSSAAGSSSSAAGSAEAAAPVAKVMDARFAWPPVLRLKEGTNYQHATVNSFTLHGVWPKMVATYTNPPRTCTHRLVSGSSLTIQKFSQMIKDDAQFYQWALQFEGKWTGGKPVPNPNDYKFWRNQWLHHGIYWGANEGDVFEYLRRSANVNERFVPTLQRVADHFGYGGHFKNEYLEWMSTNLFESRRIYIRCYQDDRQTNYLFEISVCVDYDTMENHIDCPDNERWDDVYAFSGRCPDNTLIWLLPWQ